jgi:hypothetical protein
VGFLKRDFERDHLAEKSNRTKMGQKIHCAAVRKYAYFSHTSRKKNDIPTEQFIHSAFISI